MEKALEGIRVLDVTRALAGPYAAMILADLGADVIKVEAPGSRYDMSGTFSYKGMDPFFLALNRNKRALAVDLTRPEGRGVFYDLVRHSDVVLDNFRPGVTARLGIDYDTLSQVNPGIICCSITGFGPDGPYSHRPAYDLIVQAIGGGVAITGDPQGPPVRNGVAVADQGAGFFAAIGILAAIQARNRTGRGQRVETNLLDAMLHQVTYEASLYFVSGVAQGPIGSGHMLALPYGIYPTADGYIAIAAMGVFPALCRALGIPHLAKEERFHGHANRLAHRKELDQVLTETFRTKTTREWLQALEAEDVPCAPVNTLQQALEDPQAIHNGMIVEVEHVSGGKVKMIGNAVRFASTPPEERRRVTSPPLIGQHTREILEEIGYPRERIEFLLAQGIAEQSLP